MRTRLLATAAGAALAAGLLTAAPAAATNIGQEGCTPGYWKNHTDNWEEAKPETRLDRRFTLPESLAEYRSATFHEALSFKGGAGEAGAARILLRASVAAYLNAAHEGLGYPYRRFTEPYSIVATVDAALASGDRHRMLAVAAELDAANNLGCPLS